MAWHCQNFSSRSFKFVLAKQTGNKISYVSISPSQFMWQYFSEVLLKCIVVRPSLCCQPLPVHFMSYAQQSFEFFNSDFHNSETILESWCPKKSLLKEPRYPAYWLAKWGSEALSSGCYNVTSKPWSSRQFFHIHGKVPAANLNLKQTHIIWSELIFNEHPESCPWVSGFGYASKPQIAGKLRLGLNIYLLLYLCLTAQVNLGLLNWVLNLSTCLGLLAQCNTTWQFFTCSDSGWTMDVFYLPHV